MTKFPNYTSPHVHIQSLDSASTPEAFANRELELGTGHITVTDHGSMGACREVYSLAKQKGLKPILGLEGYFRDDSCDILASFGIKGADVKAYTKYYHLTLHYLDNEAYETGCRVLSRAWGRAERHGSEMKPLFDWNDLRELGSKNVVFTSSCLAGMIQRHILQDRLDIAKAYYERLRSLVKPGNFYVEVFPHKCDKYWVSGIMVQLEGEAKEIKFWAGKKLKIQLGGESAPQEIDAEGLTNLFKKKTVPVIKLIAQKDNRSWTELEPKLVLKATAVEGFLPNECREWCPDGDVQAGANRYMIAIAGRYGDPVIVSDDSHYAHPEEQRVQDVRLMAGGNTWRFYGSYNRQSSEDSWQFFRHYGIKEATFSRWVDNNNAWAAKFDSFALKERKSLPVSFYPSDTATHLVKLIQKHGRMNWKNPEMQERFRSEIKLLHKNGTIDFLPYFFMAEEVCDLYLRHGELTGPGRGSAAGLLLTELLGITHVDPLKYGLSQDRFMTLSRIESGKLPDIDQDLSHRDLLVGPDGWLEKRFGDHYAQISTDTMLRIKSSIKDVHRVLHGYVSPEIEALCKKLPIPPQGIEDSKFVFGYKDSDGNDVKGIAETNPLLKSYIASHPKEWDLVCRCLGLTRSKGRHASAFVVADEPIQNFIPTMMVSDVRVTQFTHKYVEEAGGIKMDFLVINSLNDIAKAIKLIQDRSGSGVDWSVSRRVIPPEEDVPSMVLDGKKVPYIRIVPHNGKFYDIWDLPEDQSVFNDICSGKTETVFQLNTPGARQWLKEFIDEAGNHAIRSIEDLAAFTALDRPGPLDAYVTDGDITRNMLQEFAARARGEDPIDPMPALQKMIPETHAVIVYQEQLTKIYQILGGTTGAEADEFRVHISKKQAAKVMKDKQVFMAGAVKQLGEEDAEKLWTMMETFARYGFNKSHAVCYVVVGYACAWLKHHYPLEWWSAVLSHADRNEISDKFWGHCGHLIKMPDIQMSGSDYKIEGDHIRAPLSLLNGVGQKAHEELVDLQGASTMDEFCRKIQERRVRNAQKDESGKIRMGRSNLNRTTMAHLIVSGAMDSFFPPETAILDKFEAYHQAMAAVKGKKLTKAERLDDRFTQLEPIEQFQMRKQILPAFVGDLRGIVSRLPEVPAALDRSKDRMCIVTHRRFEGENRFQVINGGEFEALVSNVDMQAKPIKVGLLAYVRSTRPFSYKGGKNAMELVFEADGHTFQMVKWPDKEGVLDIPGELEGSIVLLELTRMNETKPFGLDDIVLIRPPLGTKPSDAPAEATPVT